ncbi:hypothetical protein HDE77_001947 [Rhodanobacter sp. MP7CTX1]|jgi:hypothetical protein|nr:hypothetical protein [Rhodanobacter sp. MP7CTX1]
MQWISLAIDSGAISCPSFGTLSTLTLPANTYPLPGGFNYEGEPEALGCDGWFTARVTTCGELDQAIKKAESGGGGAYISKL